MAPRFPLSAFQRFSVSAFPPVTSQRKMILDDPPAIVLATISTARELLRGHDEDDILALIEEGAISHAWNIGLGDARTIRIYPASIAACKSRNGSPSPVIKDDLVLTTLLAQHRSKPFIRSTTVALILNCGSTHVINLIQARALKVLPNTTWSTGPTGAALITVESFRTFLQSRRLP